MKIKYLSFIGILLIISLVIAISGCTDFVSNSTKHFDNGVIAFDYPSNMEVVDHGSYYVTVFRDSEAMVLTSTSNYQSMKYSMNPNPKYGTCTKTTINGRIAYNITDKNGNNYNYCTMIDMGTGYIQILPEADPNVQDQKNTAFYKTYQVIVNSFQVK